MRRLRRAVSAGLLITLGIRLLLVVLGIAVLVVPLPALTGHPAAGVAALALPVPFIIARWPGSAWTTVLLLDAVLTWIVASLFEGLPPLSLTVGFGCLLYLVHATAAFAAGLPVASRIEPGLLVHAVLRLLGVVAVSILVMTAVLLLPQASGSPLLGLVGVGSALGVALMLVVLAQRPTAD